MSLDRVVGVLRALRILPPPYRVITVAGTNGKGSCVALLERI
jgi:dihydrofolate synthase/folylpolyglutamate synthase